MKKKYEKPKIEKIDIRSDFGCTKSGMALCKVTFTNK